MPPSRESALKRKRTGDDAEQDPKLKEFLDVMQAPSKAKMWANDDASIGAETAPPIDGVADAGAGENASDDQYQVLSKKAKLAQVTEKPSVDAEPAPVTRNPPSAADDEYADMIDVIGEAASNTGNGAGTVTDSDWLRSRTNRVLDLVDDDEDNTVSRPAAAPEMPTRDNPMAPPKLTDHGSEEELAAPADTAVTGLAPLPDDKIRQTGRLYLRNLHFDVTSDDLHDHFSQYGSLEEVRFHFLLLFSVQ